MKKFLLLFVLFFSVNLIKGQTVFKDYTDGKLYVKMSKVSIKNIQNENPRNIPLQKLSIFNGLLEKYKVTKVYKPFYQAFGDDKLTNILKIDFLKIGDVNAFIDDLNRINGVEYAEKVPLMTIDITPNDPTFAAHLTQINAPNAWNIFNGNSNITVAIVDNAVMWTHQDLIANTYTNTAEIAGNGIDDDANGYIDDINGWDVADNDNNPLPPVNGMDHGTHCAGIAGARTDNSVGIASIGWNIKIIPVKTTYNSSNNSVIDDGYGGIVYAANARARVISCSWGGTGSSQSEQNVINYAWIRGCIVVAAAGNNGQALQIYPGAYGNVYCVASVNGSNVKSGFSNFGAWVDIAAPGEGIYSTLPGSGTYGFKSGTSMATPLVAGLAALMLAKSSVMTQSDVLNCISSTAVNIYTLTGNSTFSTSNQLGAGRIEAYQAMICASSFSNTPPIANFFAFPLNTCPNTPVNFTDSSIYAPTSWSWVFQGGSPATSTLSNPSVFWNSPGTYSVQLTVSNTFSSSTKTKLSYITVAGPIALPLTEGFQSPAFLPVNWTRNNVYNDNIYWERVTGIGGYSTSTACARFDNFNVDAIGQRDEMRTPKYVFSNVVSARLRFDVAYARFNAFYSDTLEVKLSTNCGASWTSIYLKGGTALATASDNAVSTFTPGSTQWRTDSINVSALTAGQNNVMFSFINRGHYGQDIYLDNINLVFPTPTLNVLFSAPICENASLTTINNSIGAGSYTWNFPGGTPAISTASNPSIFYATAGIYTAQLNGQNGTNSSSTTVVFTVNPAPIISINTPTICNGAATTLSASGAPNFTWASNPSGPTLSVAPSVTTVYTVTGNNGLCSAAKTATVFVNQNPTVTVNSPTICSGQQAILSPTGATTYTFNDGAVTTSSLSVLILPAATVVYTVTGSNGLCLAQTITTVLVRPSPTLTATNASICIGSATTLSVSGASSYSWNTNASTNTVLVNPINNTIYTVTGTSLGCSSTKTVGVSVESIPNVSLSLSSPSVCAGVQVVLSASGANTFIWSNNLSGSSISVTPTTSTSYTATGTNTLCSASVSGSIVVISAPPLSINAVPSASVCSGTSVTLSATGLYNTISWLNGTSPSTIVTPTINTTYTVNGGNYLSTGCTVQSIVTVFVNSNPLSAIVFTNASCTNSCSGKASATSSNGTGPYSYSLSGSSCNTLPCLNLCVGNYTLLTTDALGCASKATFTISAPVNNLLPIASSVNSSCNNCSTGSTSVSVTGGLAPYTYTWSPVTGNSASLSGLLPGCYTVNISDANFCRTTAQTCVGVTPSTVGMNDIPAIFKNLALYPNPAQNTIWIDFPGLEFDYQLYNDLGQLLKENRNNSNFALVDVGDFAKGIYIITISRQGAKTQKKLVIE